MTSGHAPPPLDALLAQRGWVRYLARRLADSAVDADDLEQDAWLAAVRAQPHAGTGLRAWLAKVVRNAAVDRRRRAAHRGEREAASARPEATRGGAALVSDAEAHARVVQAVLALEEPYRETVLLRFYEGLPPRDVATRMQVPVETVRTRLRRAADSLRTTLGGRREDWLGALVPLLVPRAEPAAPALPIAARAPGPQPSGTPRLAEFLTRDIAGGLAMRATTKAAVAAAALLLFTGGSVWIVTSGADGTTAAIDEVHGGPRSWTVERGTTTPRPRNRARPAEAAESAGGEETAAATSTPRTRSGEKVRGRILLPDGTPAVGAAIGGPGTRGWTTADADGRFAVAAGSVEGKERPVWVLLPGHRPACVGVYGDAGGLRDAPDLRLVADEIVTVRGQVVSKAGVEIESGKVDIVWTCSNEEWQQAPTMRDPTTLAMLNLVRGSDPPPAVTALHSACRAEIQPGGRFELRVPASFGTLLFHASAPGHATGQVGPFHPRDLEGKDVRIDLTRNVALAGVVVDAASGDPIPNASLDVVSETGERRTLATDERGRFSVPPEERPCRTFTVRARGYFVLAVIAPDEGEISARLEPVLKIAGRVRLGTGAAVANAHVRATRAPSQMAAGDTGTATTCADGSFELSVGRGTYDVQVAPALEHDLRIRPATVKGVVAPRTDVAIVTEEGLSVAGRVVDEARNPVAGVLVTARSEGVWGAETTTDAGGAFVVSGLAPGAAEVHAVDDNGTAGGFLPVRIETAAGTEGLEIVVRKGLEISGRIVDEDGRPVVGREVIARDVATNPFDATVARGPLTDAEGRFRIGAIAPGTYRLCLDGHGGGWVRMWLTGGESVAAGKTDLALKLTSGGTITGEAVDASGASVKNEQISAHWTPDAWPGRAAFTDDRGRFEIRGLPLGRSYTLRIRRTVVRDVALGARDLRIEAPATK